MGFFSFIGKAVKGIAKGVGAVAKVGVKGLSVAGGLGILPGGALVGKAAGALLAAKSPNTITATKVNAMGILGMAVPILRAKTPMQRTVSAPVTRVQQLSPVMPGGAVATAGGIMPASAAPPVSYGGRSTTKKRRTTSRKRKPAKRRTVKRRLKFGSAAYRKKYLGHGKKKRSR
jgi:hypothetical protein